jgi:hypothetical protein
MQVQRPHGALQQHQQQQPTKMVAPHPMIRTSTPLRPLHTHLHQQCAPTHQRPTRPRRAAAAAEVVAVPGLLRAGFTPRKVALFVEPSPFSHISGMKNRFESLIRTLREAGDEVMVVTPDPTPPKEFCGAQVRALACCVGPPVCWMAARH